jgi:hypothetical protein
MFYQPVQDQRLFKPGVLYSQIDWTCFQTIVSEFDGRIREWYLNPARTLQCISGDYSFPVMALACLLTDTLSQFHSGNPSGRKTFKEFVRQQFPEFAQLLPTAINRPAHSDPPILTDFADVLYHGFRCGILHEAHITPYGVLSGQDTIFSCEPTGLTRYQGGAFCPTVVIYPKLFLDAVEAFLVTYVSQLLNPGPEFIDLRTHFKSRFTASFGIDITNAK